MSKNVQITNYGKKILTEKEQELLGKLSGAKKNNPANKPHEEELKEVQELLEMAEVIEFSETVPVSVIIGSRITVENLRNGDRREYVILTRATADPLKGVISNESPLAQRMMNLKLGNTFKFKDLSGFEESYKIVTIE